MIVDIQAIAQCYGGKVCKGNALIPTPGHSKRDRGTAIKASASAPDGVLVTCYNGSRADALAVKQMLRLDGFLPEGEARSLTPAEMLSLRLAEQDRVRQRHEQEQQASSVAADLWGEAGRADAGHPYLVRKALQPVGVRQAGGLLLVPMIDAGFALWNLQRIKADGTKLFLKNGRTKGLFWSHGAFLNDGQPSDGPLVIGEGYSTLSAIHDATGFGVVAALSWSNIGPVARDMRRLFPARDLILAADDDSHLAENLGLNAARSAAKSVGGLLATPRPVPVANASGADFADIPRHEIAARIAAALQGE